MRTYWEVCRAGRTCYLQLLPGRVVVGSHGPDPQSDEGTEVPAADFLAGRLNDLVREEFGADVLAQALDEVRKTG